MRLKETRTEAIRRALLERRARLRQAKAVPAGSGALREYLEREVWPLVPPGQLGRTLTRSEEDQLLGFGPQGV